MAVPTSRGGDGGGGDMSVDRDAAATSTSDLLRNNARLRVLSEVSHAFSMVATDYRVLVDRIARITADLIGDGCLVTLIDADGEHLHNVASAHRDPALEADYQAYLAGVGVSKVTSASVSAQVVRTGEPKYVPEIQPGILVSQADDALKPIVARLNVHSFVVVPIWARQKIIGTLSLVRSGPERAYMPDDVKLLQDLASRAGLAIDNARLYDELRAAVRARDEFLFVASHELRTPLTPLQLHLEVLDRRLGDCVREGDVAWLEGRARSIGRQTKRLARLIDELLDVSRITSDRLRLDTAPVDLLDVTRTAISEVHELHGLDLTRDQIHLETAATNGSVVGIWDRARLEQTVTNLLSNAVKFGHGAPIRVAVGVEGTVATLTVTDQGRGIAVEDQGRIFDKFERAVPARHYGGLGLGLFVVREVLERMGGRISVTSKLGSGSTFRIELPLGGA